MSPVKDKKKSRTKKDLSRFTHDLRTPLSVMRMTLDIFQLSKDYKEDKKIKELIKTFDRQLDNLLKKIKDFEG